ncbi:hypothetical protein TraAM80_03818 [Trypanosoma rangeli]|uniref:Uncharacterized protein n=1 Tax=Trypanosoma rangeli TaxID=5698 RepID=A0A3R7NS80_TRYRA|nr:uncharacterized protein TraAM80_03818 [Trypanosoma rangeli]RNF06873.1 hypothetical protein TraAM80_03818 [Trypanosoma rangeli]|eukprot:RNF06873.1 hypothetical protein TraAM80_03818 [Trypanosoma rangeli]
MLVFVAHGVIFSVGILVLAAQWEAVHMSTVRLPSVPPRKHVLDNRVQRSMHGWSVIEKISDFTHAVCRVTDGRGSAILIACPSADSTIRCDAFHKGQQHPQMRRNDIGVLLTTSFVFPSREEAQGSTVTFLEQPIAGTSAREGRCVEPLQVPVSVDKVFVCSTSNAPPRMRSKWGGVGASMSVSGNSRSVDYDTTRRSSMYTLNHSFMREEHAEEEELGYTLTFCDMSRMWDGGMSSNSFAKGSYLGGHPPVSSDVSISVSCAAPFFPVLQTRLSASASERHETSNNVSVPCFFRTESFGVRSAPQLRESCLIKPLPLPLLLSRIPPVRVGDCHLMITHVNGKERHYVVQTVKQVGKDSCEYDFFDPASEFSSGGPIFDMLGNFVAIQHQSGDHSYGIFTTSIVRHLFQSSVLGVCRVPIIDVGVDEAKFDMNAVVPDEVFNQPFHLNQRYCVFNVGAGDQLIEFDDFERMRMRSNIRGSTLPPSLVAPASDEVWQEFYHGFNSLILILHAFSHVPKLTKLALEEITSHKHRKDLPNVSSLGGIGLVLEIIDGYPENEEVVLAALTVLARASLYTSNREAICRCDGVLTVLEIMNEYSHHGNIQLWGFCCLYNVMASDSPVRTDSIEIFAHSQGIPLAIEALCVHRAQRYLLRYTAFALSCVAHEDARHVSAMIRGGIADVIVDRMNENEDDPFVFLGLATLLRELLYLFGSGVLLFTGDAPSDACALEVATWADGAPMPLWDASNCCSCSGEVGGALLAALIDGKVLTILGKVMACESLNHYSTAAMTLLGVCSDAVLMLLSCGATELKRELVSTTLKQTCVNIVQNFSTEKVLLKRTQQIVNVFSSFA